MPKQSKRGPKQAKANKQLPKGKGATRRSTPNKNRSVFYTYDSDENGEEKEVNMEDEADSDKEMDFCKFVFSLQLQQYTAQTFC